MHSTAGTLQADAVTKRFFSVTVVRDIALTVGPGDIVGYLGPNGSGKTTTLRMLTGLIEPSAGTITYGGRDIRADLVAYRRCLGYVPEDAHIYPFLSGREYLELVGRIRDLPSRLLDQKITMLLDLFGILPAADQQLSGYSKGMRQKVLITAALLHDPDFLVLDEPESGLDVTAGLVLRHLVRVLASRGKAVLYSSHILEAVEKVCARVIVLHEGRIVANDSVTNLRELMAKSSLEGVFAQLVVKQDPERTARDIADVAALRL